MSDADQLLVGAKELIRRRVRESIFEAIAADSAIAQRAGELQVFEDAVMAALADRRIGWALAYLAGVQMAPDVLRLCAQPPAPQPPPVGGGSRAGAG